MPVATENNGPVESTQFIDSENGHSFLNEFELRRLDSNAPNTRKTRPFKQKWSYFDEFVWQINGFYTWKIPWTIILISVVQVFE